MRKSFNLHLKNTRPYLVGLSRTLGREIIYCTHRFFWSQITCQLENIHLSKVMIYSYIRKKFVWILNSAECKRSGYCSAGLKVHLERINHELLTCRILLFRAFFAAGNESMEQVENIQAEAWHWAWRKKEPKISSFEIEKWKINQFNSRNGRFPRISFRCLCLVLFFYHLRYKDKRSTFFSVVVELKSISNQHTKKVTRKCINLNARTLEATTESVKHEST